MLSRSKSKNLACLWERTGETFPRCYFLTTLLAFGATRQEWKTASPKWKAAECTCSAQNFCFSTLLSVSGAVLPFFKFCKHWKERSNFSSNWEKSACWKKDSKNSPWPRESCHKTASNYDKKQELLSQNCAKTIPIGDAFFLVLHSNCSIRCKFCILSFYVRVFVSCKPGGKKSRRRGELRILQVLPS